MAVTAIWGVKDRSDHLINYAMNPDKTTATKALIDYAADGGKTEDCVYVTGINCLPENASETFVSTQKRWRKTTGNVAYHMYQSFAEGEVDPDTAHEIGVKLAKEIFGDRFEAIVATHLNTDNIHNHIAVNAVSFVDGKKYNDCKESYYRIREASDRLCREYGLSVIEQPEDLGQDYSEWQAEGSDVPTLRGSIRGAIDFVVKRSTSKRQFLEGMDALGFIIDESGKHPKIKHVGTERFVRFRSLGEGYTLEDIVERVSKNDHVASSHIPRQDDPRKIFVGEEEPVEIMSFIPLFRTYIRAIKSASEKPLYNVRMYYLIRQDTSIIRLYEDSLDLVTEHNLKTGQDVINYKAEAIKRIDELTDQRREMRNTLKRLERAGDTVEADKARYNIGVYSMRLSKLRREVTTCDEVLERSAHVRDNLKRIEDNNFRGEHVPHKNNKKREVIDR